MLCVDFTRLSMWWIGLREYCILNSLFRTSNFRASCFTADSYRFRMTRNSCALSRGRACVLSMIRTVRSVLVYPKNRTYSTSVLQVLFSGYFFRASLKTLPALKAGTVEAGMSIVAPVAGLCPVRASLLRDANVPKPVNRTESPFATASVIAASSESMTAAAFFWTHLRLRKPHQWFLFWSLSVTSFLVLLFCLTDLAERSSALYHIFVTFSNAFILIALFGKNTVFLQKER